MSLKQSHEEYRQDEMRAEAAEMKAAEKGECLKEGVIYAIETDHELSLEAIATEATLVDCFHLDPALRVLLIEAIEGKPDADMELGKYIRETVFDYIAEGV